MKIALDGTSNFLESQVVYAIANEALRKIEELSISDKAILQFEAGRFS